MDDVREMTAQELSVKVRRWFDYGTPDWSEGQAALFELERRATNFVKRMLVSHFVCDCGRLDVKVESPTTYPYSEDEQLAHCNVCGTYVKLSFVEGVEVANV